ncbi:MAG: tetratricopeptide (TPR) repeat protein [Myxococcota bacterium]
MLLNGAFLTGLCAERYSALVHPLLTRSHITPATRHTLSSIGLAVTSVVLAMGVCGEARASDPRLAVIDIDGNTTSDATDIHYFIEKGVRLSEAKVTEVPLDDVLNAGAYATDIQNIAFGTRELEAGLKEYSKGNCSKASERFDQAITVFERSFAFVEDPDVYLRALLNHSACLDETGNSSAAKLVLKKALVLDPRMDPKRYPGNRSLFNAALKSVRESELSSVTVGTDPQGGRVFVDGRFRGVAPAIRPGLRQGVHFVRVERQGFGRVGRTVRTTPDGDGKDIDLELEQTAVRKHAVLAGLLQGLRDDIGKQDLPKESAVSRLNSVLLVDFAVLFRAVGPSEAKKITVALYDVRTGRLLKQTSGTLDWSARNRAAKNAVIALAKDLMAVELKSVIAVDTIPIDDDPDTASSGIHTKWWFWTIIGAVAVGTTVGLVVGLQPDDSGPEGLSSDGNGSVILSF